MRGDAHLWTNMSRDLQSVVSPCTEGVWAGIKNDIKGSVHTHSKTTGTETDCFLGTVMDYPCQKRYGIWNEMKEETI